MNPKFKQKILDIIAVTLLLLLAAALIALWVTSVFFEDFEASEGFGLAIGKITFVCVAFALLRRRYFHRLTLARITTVILNISARFKARKRLDRRYAKYKERKYREQHRPYFETRF